MEAETRRNNLPSRYRFALDFLSEDEDGSMSVWLTPLNIGENGTDADVAFANLRDAARDYACHYIQEWDYYKLFENTRSLRPYVERILLASTEGELTAILLGRMEE